MQSLEGLVGTGLQKCDSVYELTGPHDLDGYFQKQKQTNKQKNKGSYKPTREYETSFKPLPSPTHLALPIPPSPTLCVQPPTLPPPNAASTDNKGRWPLPIAFVTGKIYAQDWSAGQRNHKKSLQRVMEGVNICIFVFIWFNSFNASRIYELKKMAYCLRTDWRTVWTVSSDKWQPSIVNNIEKAKNKIKDKLPVVLMIFFITVYSPMLIKEYKE